MWRYQLIEVHVFSNAFIFPIFTREHFTIQKKVQLLRSLFFTWLARVGRYNSDVISRAESRSATLLEKNTLRVTFIMASCTTVDLAFRPKNASPRDDFPDLSSDGGYASPLRRANIIPRRAPRPNAPWRPLPGCATRPIVGFWPGERGPVFIPGNARLGSQRRVRRLTAAGSWLVHVSIPIFQASTKCRRRDSRERARFIPFKLVSEARALRATSHEWRVFRELPSRLRFNIFFTCRKYRASSLCFAEITNELLSASRAQG